MARNKTKKAKAILSALTKDRQRLLDFKKDLLLQAGDGDGDVQAAGSVVDRVGEAAFKLTIAISRMVEAVDFCERCDKERPGVSRENLPPVE